MGKGYPQFGVLLTGAARAVVAKPLWQKPIQPLFRDAVYPLLCLLSLFCGLADAAQTAVDVSQTLNHTGSEGAMNSTLSTLLAVMIFLLLPLVGAVYFYNSIVNKEEAVFSAWAQVESNYQRRSDLIPNLVKTVSAYLEHEKSTLVEVTEARQQERSDMTALLEQLQQARSATEALAGSEPGALADQSFLQSFDSAQAEVGGLMSRLLATVEAYPDLKANDQLLALQAQLEGTENRINVSRIAFNRDVETFNKSIRVIPGSLIAGLGNFQRKAYFTSDSGAREAVQVDFN